MLRPIDDLDIISEGEQLPPDDRAGLHVRRALDDIYRRQKPWLAKFFSRRAGRDDADDLVQDTFVRYAGRSQAFPDTVEEPDAYLTSVAKNLLRDRAKFAVRRAAAHHQTFEDDIAGADPIGQLEDRDLVRRLDVAIRELKPRTREVFVLHRVEGLTYVQIAENTGMSIRTVKKQMAKALFQLRRDIGPL